MNLSKITLLFLCLFTAVVCCGQVNSAQSVKPWVSNMSKPHSVTMGLQGRHLTVWASHGRYYDFSTNQWKWQRPKLFGTTEDLYTQTIVIPYLIPMLENAGAIVFSPRERDWQTHEIIIDNDQERQFPSYIEVKNGRKWTTAHTKGWHWDNTEKVLHSGDAPFSMGTARMAKTTRSSKHSEVHYQPFFPEAGKYAVYVSYPEVANAVDDAQYHVWHQGIETVFKVNQQMGSGTWVYLGSFFFDAGSSQGNKVVLSNKSEKRGVVVADAVRFGGGMGNVARNNTTSQLPRTLEGARYYAQWAGAPSEVYNGREDTNDYADDINTRSLMSNWIAGGSATVPNSNGKRVPIELSLAVHSDAGYDPAGTSLVGSLAICTTGEGNGLLASGKSRTVSTAFAQRLLANAERDIKESFGNWNIRALWDKNYSETRLPQVTSAIFETLSHQSFPDMRMGQDPTFKFTLARSIYKTILQQVASLNGIENVVVSPLAPLNVAAELIGDGKVKLSWQPQYDRLEQSAAPTSYNIYTAIDNGGFDNGTNVSATAVEMTVQPGHLYSFRITAVNDGGESFPTPVMSVSYAGDNVKNVLVVNCFHRVSSPAIIDNETQQGFDFSKDYGVPFGTTNGWSGAQTCYDRNAMGIEGPGGLGYGGDELTGTEWAGNTFNYIRTHAEALHALHKYNIASCESGAVESGAVELRKYNCIDLSFGLEKCDTTALVQFKTFTQPLRTRILQYAAQGGNIFASGAYLCSDMALPEEQLFMQEVFSVSTGNHADITGNSVEGLGVKFSFNRRPKKDIFMVQNPETVEPLGNAFCAMRYDNGAAAAVANNSDKRRSFIMAFPVEAINEPAERKAILKGIINYLTQ